MGFDKTTYNNQYKREKYYRFQGLLPKEYKEYITNRTSDLGISVSQYMKRLIDADLNITSDNVKTPDR